MNAQQSRAMAEIMDRLPLDVRKQVQVAILRGEDPRAAIMRAVGR